MNEESIPAYQQHLDTANSDSTATTILECREIQTETWEQRLPKLRSIPSVTWVGRLAHFTAPSPGQFFETNGHKFFITKSAGIDGIVLGVAPRRAACLVAVEMPTDDAVAVVAQSPATLETVVPHVLKTLMCTNIADTR